MNHLDLFSGIGGFALAARWMGWQTIGFCEIDGYCQKVLRKHWPDVKIVSDIHDVSRESFSERADIITGGFPCQPFSIDGKRKGRDDDRYLWPQMLRVIEEVRPTYIVAENVYGFLNIDNGESADLLCADLEAVGYESPAIFDASSDFAGVPTMERHVWFISKAVDQRCERREEIAYPHNGNERQFPGADQRIEQRRDISETQFCRVGERVSSKLDKYQRDRLRGLGNAIIPQVAYEIFRAIEAS